MGKSLPKCRTCGVAILRSSPEELADLLERCAEKNEPHESAPFHLGALKLTSLDVAARLRGFCGFGCRQNKRSLEQLDAFKAAAKRPR